MRLAIYEKDIIVNTLLAGLTTDVNKLRQELSDVVEELSDAKLPEEVIELFTKYPELSREYFSQSVVLTQPNGDKRTVYYKAIMSGKDDEYLVTAQEAADNEELQSILKELCEKEEARIELRRDMNKLLSTINSYKQLKDRFPIGYNVIKDKSDKAKDCESKINSLPESITDRLEGFHK